MSKFYLMMLVFCGGLIGCGDKEATPPPENRDIQTAEVSGTWNTVFSGAVDAQGKSAGSAVVLNMTQNKEEVQGTYAAAKGAPPVAPGSIKGVISGSTLKGTWEDQSGAKGPFEFKFNPSASSFNGFWKSDQLRGDWVGTRAP